MEHGNHDNCKCTPSACKQSIEDMDFERGIWYAAQHGDYDRVKKLLIRGVDVVDNAGYTALHYAARNGHTRVCQLLVNFGASLDAQTRAGLATPLHRAAAAGRTDIVKLLVASGANILLKNADGQTPLHRAVAEGHIDVAKYLVSIDSKMLSAVDNYGRLPKDLTNMPPDESNSFLFQS